MKVLLCSPLSGKIGGISLWTKHIVNYFNDPSNGIEIDLVDAGRKNDIYPNTPIYERISKGIQEYSEVLKNVKRKLKTEKFDVLHLVSSASISLIKDYLILKCAKKNNIVTTIHFHFGRIPQIFEDKKWEYHLIRKIISLANSVITIDNLSFQTLQKEGYKNIFFLPNPLSPDVVQIIEDNKQIVRIPNKIMFAGHVIPTKGINELIQACKNIPGIDVYIIGSISKEMNVYLHNQIRNGINNFFVLGEKNHETIIKEMLTSRIFLLPSYTEGFPNVILESMAAGCSIISTDVGAIPEMLAVSSVHPCGIVIEPKNADQLEKAIKNMLNDKTKAGQYAVNAVLKVNAEYNIKVISEKLIYIWNKTIKLNKL